MRTIRPTKSINQDLARQAIWLKRFLWLFALVLMQACGTFYFVTESKELANKQQEYEDGRTRPRKKDPKKKDSKKKPSQVANNDKKLPRFPNSKSGKANANQTIVESSPVAAADHWKVIKKPPRRDYPEYNTRPQLERVARFDFPGLLERVFYQPKQRRLIAWIKGEGFQVLDLDKMEPIANLVLADSGNIVSVGGDTLAVYSSSENTFRFYNTNDFSLKKAILSPLDGSVVAFGLEPMGHRNMMILYGKNNQSYLSLMDLDNYQTSPIQTEERISYYSQSNEKVRYLQALPGFQTFLVSSGQYSRMFHFKSDTIFTKGMPNLSTPVTLTDSGMVFNSNWLMHGDNPWTRELENQLNIPNSSGAYYFGIEPKVYSFGVPFDTLAEFSLDLYETRTNHLLAEIGLTFKVPKKSSVNPDREPIFSIDYNKHYKLKYLDEEALMLVQFEARVAFYRLALTDIKLKVKTDTLFVTSPMPLYLEPGKKMKHQIEAVSGDSKLRYELLVGPSGLKVSKKGLVTWKKPKGNAGLNQVLIRITNAMNGEAFYEFKI